MNNKAEVQKRHLDGLPGIEIVNKGDDKTEIVIDRKKLPSHLNYELVKDAVFTLNEVDADKQDGLVIQLYLYFTAKEKVDLEPTKDLLSKIGFGVGISAGVFAAILLILSISSSLPILALLGVSTLIVLGMPVVGIILFVRLASVMASGLTSLVGYIETLQNGRQLKKEIQQRKLAQVQAAQNEAQEPSAANDATQEESREREEEVSREAKADYSKPGVLFAAQPKINENETAQQTWDEGEPRPAAPAP